MSWTCPCGTSNGDERQSCRACSRPLFEQQAVAQRPTPTRIIRYPQQQPLTFQASRQFTCKTCDQGTLEQKKVFRMSGPAVVIGFILLIPSVLGMMASALLLFGIVSFGSGESTSARTEAIEVMRQARFPQVLMNAIADGRDADVEAWIADNEQFLSRDQVSIVRDAQRRVHSHLAGSHIGMTLGGGFAIAIGIACFVSGLLGWLLVMKKRILQCSLCGAVVNAS